MRKLLVLVAVIVALGSTGCTATPPVTQQTRVQPMVVPPWLATAVDSGFRNQARDPSSVTIGQMMAGLDPAGHIVICGYANGRNGYGGFTGMQPFIGTYGPVNESGRFTLLRHGGSADYQSAVVMICRLKGLMI